MATKKKDISQILLLKNPEKVAASLLPARKMIEESNLASREDKKRPSREKVRSRQSHLLFKAGPDDDGLCYGNMTLTKKLTSARSRIF
jgi:hypothetical protein